MTIDAAGVAALVALAAGTYLLAFRPALAARDRVDAARAAEQTAERELTERTAERRRAERALEEARNAMSAEAVALQGVQALNQRVREITELSAEAGLEADGIVPGAPVRGEMFDVSPIELRGRGSYGGLSRFLHLLNTRLADIGVAEFSIGAADPGAEAQFSVSLTWYTAPDGRVSAADR